MRYIITFILLVFATCGYSQSPKQVLRWINTANAVNKNFYYEIPFEYRNNWIIVKVNIGGDLYDYIFDTGGYNDITEEMQRKNNFPILTTQTVGSANQLKSKVDIVKIDSFKIGELLFKDIAALKIDFSKSPSIVCTINGGLIGASIIKNYTWQIDYPNRKLIVTDKPETIPGLEGAVRVPVTFNSRLMPYIKVKVNNETVNCMFDMGSASLFSLTESTATKILEGRKRIEITGARTEGGNGTREETVYVVSTDSLSIGPLTYTQVPTYIAASNNESLIGCPIIKDYIVTLNFRNNEMYFKPVKQFTNDVSLQSFGITLAYKNNKVFVNTLFKGMAADRAGILVNDEVTAIDGTPVQPANDCEGNANLKTLLAGKDNLTLTLLQNGSPRNVQLAKEKISSGGSISTTKN